MNINSNVLYVRSMRVGRTHRMQLALAIKQLKLYSIDKHIEAVNTVVFRDVGLPDDRRKGFRK